MKARASCRARKPSCSLLLAIPVGETSLHTIQTIEDLMGVLDDHPGWLDALRARVLPREVLELPRIVSNLAGNTDQRFDRVDQRMDKFEQRMDRLENDMGVLRGAHARNAAIEYADDITDELGLDMVRVLRGAEIRTLARSKGTKDIPANDLRSFRAADLIIEARDGKGETCFVVVEVSFTANGRDTHRAIRNAGLMSRFTGKRAYPVVTGLRRDDGIRRAIASGDVYWYQLAPEAFEVA